MRSTDFLSLKKGVLLMDKNQRFAEYYLEWIHMYKEGSVRQVTMDKYYLTHRELLKRWPTIKVSEINHYNYQKLINDYAENHEYLTVKGFHHHCKAAIVDALEDGLLSKDPTRHLVLKGKSPKKKKVKYLSFLDLKRLINQLNLTDTLNLDWLIFLMAKTGMRYAEALGITPNDFDFENYQLQINKTWNYKSRIGKFQPTKNKSSNRTISLDPITSEQFEKLVKKLDPEKPIFIQNRRVYTSTVNNHLDKYCKKAGIEVISVHGLRHTHASLLLYDGVSIPSVAKRLGHANTITTQQTYVHIVKELADKDNQKIMENMIRLS